MLPARLLVAFIAVPCALAAQIDQPAPVVLPAPAVAQLAESLAAAQPHARHVWRDAEPTGDNGIVYAYIEIPRGERRKFEFDMRANQLAVDRVMPESVGGYPVNYGFVPQTVSYDGDPFDALVLGPPLPRAAMVGGVIVGVMHMEDEKGLDSKVVVSVPESDGRPRHALTEVERLRLGDFFRRYKLHETGKVSKVAGWGPPAEGRRLVTLTHAFFKNCRNRGDHPCRIVE